MPKRRGKKASVSALSIRKIKRKRLFRSSGCWLAGWMDVDPRTHALPYTLAMQEHSTVDGGVVSCVVDEDSKHIAQSNMSSLEQETGHHRLVCFASFVRFVFI